jgi:dihydroorotase
MIDPHVHCRDWDQSHKETIRHALAIAEKTGLSGIFDMPNTSPVIVTRELIERRLADADKVKSSVFYGLYAGLTSAPDQIREVVRAWGEFFPRVVGLKMFAGHSVGNLGIVRGEEQRRVYRTLVEEGYDGVLVVHCEKESLLRPDLWDPKNPKSHSHARPNESEVESVRDQIRFASESGFEGTLHIAHVSVPASVEWVDYALEVSDLRVTCGLTPHHCLLNYEEIPEGEEGLLYKVNPPLRNANSQRRMLELLKEGRINWIETDHAPHTLGEKLTSPFMSGFPGLAFYVHFVNLLRDKGFGENRIRALTHENICNTFGIDLPERDISPDMDLHKEYGVDVYKNIRGKI